MTGKRVHFVREKPANVLLIAERKPDVPQHKEIMKP
jgi:hypothetical protein